MTSQAPSEFFKSQHYLDLEDEDEPRVNMCSMYTTCMYHVHVYVFPQDRCCRFCLGTFILLILLIGGGANITLIALL